jgi:hypothetical protein
MSGVSELRMALDPAALFAAVVGEPDPWQRKALRSDSKRQLYLASRQSGKEWWGRVGCSGVGVSGFFWGVAITVIGGLILAGALYVIGQVWRDNPLRRYWQTKQAEEEDRRLLWQIRLRSHDRLEAAVPIEKAAQQAQIENPAPALERLKGKGHIIPAHGTSQAYVQITLDGLRTAPPPSLERPSWWSRIFGS